jgi:uncharacterized membrane protein YozB (DUF420 family)
MDPKLLFWTGALANMWLIVAIACSGIAKVRSGDEVAHQRRMLTAASLVVLFVVAYAIKLIFLGREDLDQWQSWSVTLLRVHEFFVLCMIVGGVCAGYFIRKVRQLEVHSPEEISIQVSRVAHAKAGKFTFLSVLGAAITATGVWVSMVLRAG